MPTPTTLRLLAVAALLVRASAAAASVHAGATCHLQYQHKATASAQADLAGTACPEYAGNSCCKAKTVKTSQGLLDAYGADYKLDRCGKVSDKCRKRFVSEACLYECDVSAGKFRHHRKCSPKNTWQMSNMPIKVSRRKLLLLHALFVTTTVIASGAFGLRLYALNLNRLIPAEGSLFVSSHHLAGITMRRVVRGLQGRLLLLRLGWLVGRHQLF